MGQALAPGMAPGWATVTGWVLRLNWNLSPAQFLATS
jgi:hypothetical protein